MPWAFAVADVNCLWDGTSSRACFGSTVIFFAITLGCFGGRWVVVLEVWLRFGIVAGYSSYNTYCNDSGYRVASCDWTPCESSKL